MNPASRSSPIDPPDGPADPLVSTVPHDPVPAAHAEVALGPIGGRTAPAGARASLKSRALHSSAWTVGGYAATQLLRFLSSIILSRLLAPEVAGVMAMVSVFLQGLQMFSDVGIGPSIIHNKRGQEAEFLNTAWTVQVCRGWLLWAAACIGAWPVAQYYHEPQLVWLIMVSGSTATLNGFNSTALVSLNRDLQLRKVTILGIAHQIVSYIVIVIWAVLVKPDAWALVVGTWCGTLFYAIGSHFLVPGFRNRFHWNREDAKSMMRFGRWIFGSTVLTFIAGQADKIMMGRMLGAATLGVYGYAQPLALIAPQLIKRVGSQVAFPALAELVRERPHELGGKLRKVRMALIGVSLLMLLPLLVLGDWFVRFVYDSRWWDAGWMLQILTAGAMGGMVNASYGNVLMAMGRTFDIMLLLAIQIVFLIVGAQLGYHYWGETGFIVAVAAVEWLNYIPTAAVMFRHRVWQPELDLPALAVSAGAIALVYYL